METYKSISETLEKVRRLEAGFSGIISFPGSLLDAEQVQVTKDIEKGYNFNLEPENPYALQSKLGEGSSFSISGKDISITSEHAILMKISGTIVTGKIKHFWKGPFLSNRSYFFRLVIPIREKIKIYYHIKTKHVNTNGEEYSERIEVMLNGILFNVYQHSENSRTWLVCDSTASLTLSQFIECYFSIFVGFAFMTGCFPLGEGYYFGYENNNFRDELFIGYSVLRGNIQSIYTPICTNLHIYIKDTQIADSLRPQLNALSIEIFSSLCQRIYSTPELLNSILFFLETSQTKSSLLAMPCCYSVVLESLTNLICKENADRIAPIKDKSSARKLIADLKEVLKESLVAQNKLAKELRPDKTGVNSLRTRIENINQPLNSEKLIKPFTILEIELNDEDRKAIEFRNDLLHGKILLKDTTRKLDYDSINDQLAHVSLRFYTLITAIILRHAGYTGNILNQPKIFEYSLGQSINEGYLRQCGPL